MVQHYDTLDCLVARRVFKDTGRLLIAFLLGSVATVIGTLVAFKALPLLDLGADGWKASLATCPVALLLSHSILCGFTNYM